MAERFVAVTQRVVEVSSYGEVRDCLDQEWAVWLASCGLTPVPVPNQLEDVSSFLTALDVVGVVLTGGNNLAAEVYDVDEPVPDHFASRDRTEFAIVEHCTRTNLPAIGFCHGMQVLHVSSGGRLARLASPSTDAHGTGHVATVHEVALTSAHWRELAGDSTLTVNSFHDYGFHLDDVTDDWDVAAAAVGDGVVEGIVHRTLPFVGVGWHPERSDSAPGFDRALLDWSLGRADTSVPDTRQHE